MGKFVAIFNITNPMHASPPHQHPEWEICFYTSGEGVGVMPASKDQKEQQVPFRPGSILCYPPNLPHYHVPRNGCTLYCIFTNKFDAHGPVLSGFADSADRDFLRTTRMLHREFLKREGDWELAAQQLMDRLLLLLVRLSGERPHPLVERMKRTIFDHINDSSFHIGDAMARIPMSTDHLRKLFHQATGRTPTQYLIDQRMLEARRLLKAGAYSAKEVAQRVGIDDPYYFSKLFLRATGQRPSVYAKAGMRGRKGREPFI